MKTSNTGKTYAVVINDKDMKYPTCQCYEWKRSKMPCKNMIDIFENFENIN